ncbi:hypothetical protein APED_23725 [Acanthopleuribacter pedis]
MRLFECFGCTAGLFFFLAARVIVSTVSINWWSVSLVILASPWVDPRRWVNPPGCAHSRDAVEKEAQTFQHPTLTQVENNQTRRVIPKSKPKQAARVV